MGVDRLKGKAKEVEGKIQRKVGEVTGDRSQQAKGLAKEAEGKAQEAVGRVKDAGKEVMRDIRRETRKTERDIREEKRRPSSVQPERKPQSPGNDVVPERDDDIGEEVA